MLPPPVGVGRDHVLSPRVSPTAIGLMSDLDASVVLFKATRFPSAKNLDMEGGALPPASKLTKHLKEVQIGV